MKKVNIVLLQAFERDWFDVKKYTNLDTHVTRMIKWMIKLGKVDATFHLLSKTKNTTLKHDDGYPIILHKVNLFPLKIPLEISFDMLKNLKLNKKEIWHVNTYYYLMFDLLVPYLKIKKQKIIAHHRGGGFTWKGSLYYLFQYILVLPWLLRFCDKIIVQNKFEYNRLQKFYFINKKKIIWIPNAIDMNIFKPGNKTKARKELKLPNEILLSWVGRIEPSKGIYNLLEVVKILSKTKHKFKVVIVGAGNKNHVEQFLKTIKEEKMQRYFIFSKGHVALNDMIKYYQASDIYIHSNIKSEGTGTSPLEAEATHLPAVVYNIPGPQDSVIDGKTGYVIPNKDYEEYAKKLLKLMKDEKLRKKMGAEARKHVDKYYNVRKITARYIKLYKELS